MAHSHRSSYRRNEDSNTYKAKITEIRNSSRSIKGVITRYVLDTRTVTDGERVKRVAFGEEDQSKPHKTILLVGETGVGKSTIINSIINYMLGVESEDRIWCEVNETKENQTKSQTNRVTVYDVFTEHSPISLTVIDTPGFGSTEGIEEDLNVTESLYELFRSNDGVDEIDAVCLVVESNTKRLTERQLYVFNAVLSLFGRDVEKNIVVFVTHASKKPTNAIKAIKESKIPCAQTDKGEPVYFRFDNSHCENFDDDEILEEEYPAAWGLLIKTMESFLSFLNENKPISVKMTVAVLKNRKQLTASIFNLKDKITLIEHKQNELQQTKQALEKHEKEKGDKNFEVTVEESYKEKVPIEYQQRFGWKQATSCTVCEENCHYPGCWWVKNLSWCSVMDNKGKCTVCTGRCHYTKHVKENIIFVVKKKTVKKTEEDLKKKYEKEFEEKKSLISCIEDDMKVQEREKIRLVEECYECVIKLEEIALTSDSVYTLQYLDFLIDKVKETGNTQRVEKLQEMKRRAEDSQLAQATKLLSTMCSK